MRAMLLAAVVGAAVFGADGKKPKLTAGQKKLKEQCQTCRDIVTQFYSGYAKTDTIHFRGESKGWSLDNEKFLGRYKMGEARLAEITESLCTEKNRKCNALMEDLEEPLEEWWAKREEKNHDFDGLEKHLCVDTLKACCPRGHWGSKCTKCPAAPEGEPCGRGTCDGDGMRIGTGKCKCDSGWALNAKTKSCTACRKNYFKYASEDGNDDCLKCAPACKGCTGPTDDDCRECAAGFERSNGMTAEEKSLEARCVDIDECATHSADHCPDTQTYCSNTPGNYSCETCDAACGSPADSSVRKCTGPGLGGCATCASGYTNAASGTGCEDIDECADLTLSGCDPKTQYCSNYNGSFTCLSCDKSCSTEHGCTGPGKAECGECASGYARTNNSAASDCDDVNECDSFSCDTAAGLDCTNTEGSFTCACYSPNIVNADGGCERPAYLPALQSDTDFPEDVVSKAVDLFEDKTVTDVQQRAAAFVGTSKANIKVIAVHFEEKRFDEPPVVTFVRAKDECCGDQFGFSVQNITIAGFDLAIWRTDTQSGWGQELKAEWGARGTRQINDEL